MSLGWYSTAKLDNLGWRCGYCGRDVGGSIGYHRFWGSVVLTGNPTDGSRAIIRVRWKGRNSGGHVFMAEQVDGVTRFIDSQTGSDDCSSYFNDVRKREMFILRVDDNPVTGLIEKAAVKR